MDERPLRLLVVDDEPIELSSISQFLRAELGPGVVVETATDGIELVSKGGTFQPDLVLTDIEMPGINGLEALRVVLHHSPRCRTILYTAYSHFEYAREALNLRAEAYILKPAKRIDLLLAVRTALDQIRAAESRERETSRAKDLVDNLRPHLEIDCMTSVFLSQVDEVLLSRCCELAGLTFRSGIVVTFRVVDEVGGAGPRLENETWFRTTLGSSGPVLVGPWFDDKVSCLVVLAETVPDQAPVEWVVQWACRMVEEARRKFGRPVQAGIGPLSVRPGDLPASYQESVRALTEGTGGPVWTSEHEVASQARSDPFRAVESAIRGAFEARDRVGLASHLDDLWDQVGRLGVPLAQQKSSALALLSQTLKLSSKFQGRQDSSASILRLAFEEVRPFQGSRELKAWLGLQMKKLMDDLGESAGPSRSIHTRNAIRYIEANYHKPLSLDIVAEAVGVSPFHLSHLFAQDMNQSYVAFLTAFRIRRAREIMGARHVSADELAHLVGFSSASYLAKTFLKVTGHSLKSHHGWCLEDMAQ